MAQCATVFCAQLRTDTEKHGQQFNGDGGRWWEEIHRHTATQLHSECQKSPYDLSAHRAENNILL